MKYKGYKLTNFRCDEADAPKVIDGFKKAVDAALEDPNEPVLGVQIVTDLTHLIAGKYFNESPIKAPEKFVVLKADKDKKDD